MTTFVNMPSLIQEQESDEDAAAATLSSAASDEEVDLTSFGHLPTPLHFSPLRTNLQQEMNGLFGGGGAAAVALSAFLVSIWPPLCKFPHCGWKWYIQCMGSIWKY